jgi:transcriptional regulator with XRE-family HTH domain
MDEKELKRVRTTLGRTLLNLRLDAGYTQADLAKEISLTQPTIQRIETGKINVPLETLYRYVSALGYTLAQVFNEGEKLEELEQTSKVNINDLDDHVLRILGG